MHVLVPLLFDFVNDNYILIVYGDLGRLKFFWRFLEEKNPQIRDDYMGILGYDYKPINFAIEIRNIDVFEFMNTNLNNPKA